MGQRGAPVVVWVVHIDHPAVEEVSLYELFDCSRGTFLRRKAEQLVHEADHKLLRKRSVYDPPSAN